MDRSRSTLSFCVLHRRLHGQNVLEFYILSIHGSLVDEGLVAFDGRAKGGGETLGLDLLGERDDLRRLFEDEEAVECVGRHFE